MNLVLALVLVITPPDAEILDVPYLSEQVHQVALSLELIDKRENHYLFRCREDFASDVKLVRIRYEELRDAPPLCDCKRFPSKETCCCFLEYNRKYREYLDSKLPLDPRLADCIHETLQETDWLYKVWDLARDADCDYYYVNVRRNALQRLREEIGVQAYYAGCLPPIVPIWRFNRVD